MSGLLLLLFGATGESVYLSPAPFYHAAPLRFCLGMNQIGATVVAMEHFDPEQYLQLIERFRITHTQVVPTMFIRLLKLPPEVRAKYDVSSLQCVVHAAAPCPVQVKKQMIEWFGPVIHEYYAGTEGCLLYTSDAADERSSVDLGGRCILKKKNSAPSIAYKEILGKKYNK